MLSADQSLGDRGILLAVPHRPASTCHPLLCYAASEFAKYPAPFRTSIQLVVAI